MYDLSTIELLLSKVPTEDGWFEFADELNKLSVQELEIHSLPIQKLLSSWPDHLRRPLIDWLDENDSRRLSFCRIFLYWPSIYFPSIPLPDLTVQKGSNYSIDHPHRQDQNNEFGWNVDSSKFSPRLLAMAMDSVPTRLLVLANYSDNNSFHDARGFQALIRIDYSSSQATPLFAQRDTKPFQRTQSLLLASLEGSRVLMVSAPGDRQRIGVADLYLLEGQEIILEHHWAGQNIQLPEIPQRSRASIFRLSGDQRYLWGYLFSGKVIRLDLHTLQLEELNISANYICDAIPFGDGLVLSLLMEGFLYVNAAMKVAEIRHQPILGGAGQIVGLVASRSVGISASAILEGRAPIEHTLAMLEWDEPSQSLQVRSHLAIAYRRPDWNAPFLQFKVKQTGRHWLCAYLSPLGFDNLHVHDLVTGKSAVLEWHSDPSECDVFDFDSEGEHIVFWEFGFLKRWRFVLA
jgi:hypothetical protein